MISLIKSPPGSALSSKCRPGWGRPQSWLVLSIYIDKTEQNSHRVNPMQWVKQELFEKYKFLLLTIWGNKAVSFSVWWRWWRLETAISWSAGLNGTKNMQESGEPRGASLLSQPSTTPPPLSVTQESLLAQWSIILSQIKPRVDCKAQHQHQQLPAASREYLLCGELDGPIVLTTIVLPLLPVIDLMNAGQIREQKDMLNLGKLWRWRRLLIFLCLFIIAELRYHTHSNLSSLV